MRNRKHNFFKERKVILPYPWYSEVNVTRAGESAFKIRVPFHFNPVTEQPFKSWWIRGFKRQEKLHNEALRYSMKVQETIGLEEVTE